MPRDVEIVTRGCQRTAYARTSVGLQSALNDMEGYDHVVIFPGVWYCGVTWPARATAAGLVVRGASNDEVRRFMPGTRSAGEG